MYKSNETIKHIVFAGFCCALFIHLAFTFTGFYGDDDINYVRYAADIAKNGVPEQLATSHFQLRWTVIYVTAFFFKIFGVSSFTSTLCSFLSVIGSGFLLSRILFKYPLFVYCFSLLLFFFAYSNIFYMQRTLPDATVCFAILWMFYSYRSNVEQQTKFFSYGVQFSLALMLAIISKESIIIALPLFLILLLNDLLKRINKRFWLTAIAALLILVTAYLLYFKITTGSLFFRYNLLQAGSYLSECSYDMLPFSNTLRRVGYELWKNMLVNGDMLILLPALTAFIYKKKIKSYVEVNDLNFSAFVILLLAANFMTISFTHYVPLCPAPRHFLFLLPFAAIIGGPMMFAFFTKPKQFLLLPLFMAIATIVMFYIQAGNNKYLYLLFSCLLIARLIMPFFINSKISFSIAVIGFTALFSLNFLIDFIQPKYPYYKNHKELVERSIRYKNITGTLFSSDQLSGELTEFFLDFNSNQLRILPMDSILPNISGNLYYINVADINKSNQGRIDSLINYNKLEILLIDREKNVSLYKLNNNMLDQLKD